jgi:hypothetical protein
MTLTDRSRIKAFQECPRSRYLGYHIGGIGLQRIRKSLPLQFGSAFHTGAERLLRGDVEGAVAVAHQYLNEQFAAHAVGFDGELPDDVEKALQYGREEQLALAEALLRGWWAFEGESFLENFDVIEVEREGRAQLSDDQTLMFRPDALVCDKASDDLYVVSWKTCATFGKRNVDQARHEMQSISEVWGVENETCESAHPGLKVEGVLYKWIVKGRRDKDEWDGLYKQNTHLIYGWHKLGAGSGDDDWSWSFKWSDPSEINPKTGKAVGHTLGKGWQKVPIWRDYPGGVKQWIDDLAHQRVNPRMIDPLLAVFPQALSVERPREHVESWRRQVIAQELYVNSMVKSVEANPTYSTELLDSVFPQHTHSCHSYSGCPFIDICWNGAKAEAGEIYQVRSANHPEREGDE